MKEISFSSILLEDKTGIITITHPQGVPSELDLSSATDKIKHFFTIAKF